MEKRINILYVDDEANNLVAFKSNFRVYYNVYTAQSAKEGLEILRANKIHILITDQRMPNMTGVEFLESVLKEFPEPIRMLLTGYVDIDAVIEAINKGQVYKYIMKPLNVEDLKITINNAFETYTLREENKELVSNLLKVNKQIEFMLRQKLTAYDINPDA